MPRSRSTRYDKDQRESSDETLSSPPRSPPAPPPTSFKNRISRYEYKEDDEGASNKPTKSTSAPITIPRSTKRVLPTGAPPGSLTPKKQKRNPSKYAPPSKYAHLTPLTDILAPNLICIFVGTNPGIGTAIAGHAYAHPSNLFWKLLHSSGLTDRRLRPEEDGSLPALYSMGNTNIVQRPSKDAAELSKKEMAEGTRSLEDKVRTFRPEAVCIVGKGIWEAVWRFRYGRGFRKGEFEYGWQAEEQNMGKVGGGAEGDGVAWRGAKVFVTTSTSGLAASLKPAEKEEIWRPFGEWVNRRREERTLLRVSLDKNVVDDVQKPERPCETGS